YESFGQYIRWYKVTSIILLVNIIFFAESAIRGEHSFLFQQGALAHWPPFNSEIQRYFMSMFLHFDFGHVLFNLFAIFVFAPPLEYLLGPWKYTAVYLGSGLIGNLTSMWLSDFNTVSVGASGAIYGLYGAYIYLIWFKRNILDEASRKTIM